MTPIALFPYVVACLAGALIALAAGARICARTSAKVRSLTAALDHMSQGLCMWDAHGRLILCNVRYTQMYGLDPKSARPGTSLRDIIEHRIAAGSFSGNPDQREKCIPPRISERSSHALGGPDIADLTHRPFRANPFARGMRKHGYQA